jgi:hypothetical protein
MRPAAVLTMLSGEQQEQHETLLITPSNSQARRSVGVADRMGRHRRSSLIREIVLGTEPAASRPAAHRNHRRRRKQTLP